MCSKHCSTQGFTATEDILPDLEAFVCEVLSLAQKWLDATADRGDTLEAYLDDVGDQCREIAEQDARKGGYEKLGDEQLKAVSIAIVNVETRVQFGSILNNEYNGIVWWLREECSEILQLCHDTKYPLDTCNP